MISADTLAAFFSESDTHLEVMEQSLLSLESGVTSELVNELFRAVHSLKGNAGLVGFTEIHAMASTMETVLDAVRKGEKKYDQSVKDGMYRDLDKIKAMVEKAGGASAPAPKAEEEKPKAVEPPPPPPPKEEKKPEPDVAQEQAEPPPAAVEAHKHPGGKQSFLTFNLKNEEYGIPITTVKEIIIKRHVTRVPNARSYVAGIMNLRGMVIPVIDSGCKLGMGLCAEKAENIIIVENEGSLTGLMVDMVRDIVTFEEEMIVEGRSSLGSLQSKFIQGVGKADKKNIILLDVHMFCDPTEKYF